MRRISAFLLAASVVAAGGAALWVHQRGRRLSRALRRAPGSWPVQTTDDGHGPLYFRSYHLDVRNPTLSAVEIMKKVQADLDAFSPFEIARFEKTHG